MKKTINIQPDTPRLWRGPEGQTVHRNVDGIPRYVYENNEIDSGSEVDFRNPTIKIESQPVRYTGIYANIGQLTVQEAAEIPQVAREAA